MAIMDQHWMSKIERPSRYLGDEVNAIVKDQKHVELSVALAFPDVYEVGMSHQGLKILYHILNQEPWISAERVFAPWIDLEMELRRRQIPLTSLETDTPLSEFDVVGFSLQHELSYTNVLNMLDLSGIPLLASQRKEQFPLIIAGGPSCFNPEPIADVFDLMVIGDGEEVTPEICRIIRETKSRGNNGKRALLSELRYVPGVYIPSFFTLHYGSDGLVAGIEPHYSDYNRVDKAIVSDIDRYPYPERQIVPYTELVHDRLAIEISRGCTRGCRFCQAGMVYRPVRERSPASILEKAENALKCTGYDEMSLLSLSSGDYTCIESLIRTLMNRQAKNKVAVSLPSLRIDSMNPSWVREIKRVRKTGFTLAPEAGSDRLRCIINKGLSRERILETAKAVYDAGWNLLKLYFMIGLPLEKDEDVEEIIALSKQIAGLSGKKTRKPKLNVSVATFVPKPHTPFMWTAQIPLAESRNKIAFIRRTLQSTRIRVKWNEPELSWLEGVFSRGDRRLCSVLTEAWKLGARFDAWGDQFQMDIWQTAFRRRGVDPDFYTYRERPFNEVVPWSHIRCGVSQKYLRREWRKAQEGMVTPDCREGCLECGVCDHERVDPVIFKDTRPLQGFQENAGKTIPPLSKRYRLIFTKLGHARYLGHLELVRVLTRAFRRAGLYLSHSEGYHPLPKVTFACALPVGTESIHETVEIECVNGPNIRAMRQDVNLQLPAGIRVIFVEEIPAKGKKARLMESRYLISLRDFELKEADLERFLESEHFSVVKTNKKGAHRIDARALVASMKRIAPNSIELDLKHGPGPELKPEAILKSVFSLDERHMHGIKILKTRQVLAS